MPKRKPPPDPPPHDLDSEDGFRAIFKEHYRLLWRRAARLGVPEEDRPGLIQELFLRVYRRRSHLEGVDLHSYLVRALRNMWISALRSQAAESRGGGIRFETDLSPADEPRTSRNPEDDLLARERGDVLVEAMRALPPRMRRCTVLRYLNDLKVKEIAERLGITEGAVKAHLYQARERLRDLLGPGGAR